MSDSVQPPQFTEQVVRDIVERIHKASVDIGQRIDNCRKAINALDAAKFASSSQELRRDLDKWHLKESALGEAKQTLEDSIDPFRIFLEPPTEPEMTE